MFSDVRHTFSVDLYSQVFAILAYPWRGTTPLVCIFFVGLTILLVFVNIPLSAYEVVQDFTYSPNDTSPSLPFTNIIPASLRHTAGDFMPQTFKVGDTIQIDSVEDMVQTASSVFTYVIMEAFGGTSTDSGTPVGSFPYYNNPLSSCDVLNISLFLQKEEPVSFSAIVSCWTPTYYKMALDIDHASLQDHIARVETFMSVGTFSDLDSILMDLEYGWNSENVTLTSKNEGESAPNTTQNVTGIELAVFPCCICTDWFSESYTFGVNQYDPLLRDHPPCDDDIAKFQATGMVVYYGQDDSFSYMNVTLGGNILPSNQELEVPSNVQLVLQNALQAVYSAIRLDLGISPPNQIFASSIMFNKSISSVSLFELWTNGTDPPRCAVMDPDFPEETGVVYVVNDSYANCIRRARSEIPFWNYELGGSRVPAVPYLRPVFRRKPMLSAVSSVFVATFAMVSAAWSLFNFIAGSFCQTQIDVSGCPHCKHCRGPAGDSESVLLSRRSSRYEAIAMGEMQEDGV
ncbi:hypothetical protein EDD85DRAFT_951857 [Armillaria nabsnona]|nr:hypothetical protein EDD85DRAFT_951857 [Armillaria nabsnona]